jgi:integrase/recombinase XerD
MKAYYNYTTLKLVSKGKQYSEESIYKVIKQSSGKAKIKQRVYPHILRHSSAIHLPEQGIDLRYIQEILGHSSSKTTEIYTHVSKKKLSDIVNPIDIDNIDSS